MYLLVSCQDQKLCWALDSASAWASHTLALGTALLLLSGIPLPPLWTTPATVVPSLRHSCWLSIPKAPEIPSTQHQKRLDLCT